MDIDSNLIELLTIIFGSPVLAGIVAFVAAKWASGKAMEKALETADKALETCNTAKDACLELLHTLRDEVTSLKTAVVVAEGRIAGLEADREGRDASK